MAGGNSFNSLMKRTFLFLIAIVSLMLLLCRQNVVIVGGGHEISSQIQQPNTFSRSKSGEISSQIPQHHNISKETSETMKPVESLQSKSDLVRVSWTSVGGKGEKDSFHFFSAYYDNRNVPLRPAVLVFGYAWNQVKMRPLHCMFKYNDGHTECVKKPLKMRQISCWTPRHEGQSYVFYCPAQQNLAPVSVMVSEKSDCNQQFTSKQITVGNVNQSNNSPKTFGICVGGPVIENEETLQNLVEFISISRLLGAELITIYIIPEKLNRSIINYLLMRYPNVLRLIEWKNLGIWSPLHYYGQYVIIQDCLYRSMYKVEYLFHQDIDEVFIPTRGNNWSDIVRDIPGLKKGAGFVYQHSIFTLDKVIPSVKFPDNCGDFNVSKYLTRTKILPCFLGYTYKTKVMTKPRLTLEADIHHICVVMPGYSNSIKVPPSLAILGHFRNQIPQGCINERRKPVINMWASKYADRLHKEMCCINNKIEMCN